MATGGVLQTVFGGPTSFGTDEFTKGHFQFGLPLDKQFQIAGDVTHDFERTGGFKEDFTAEVRLSYFFTPRTEQPAPLK